MKTINNNVLLPVLLEICLNFGQIKKFEAIVPKNSKSDVSLNNCNVEITLKSGDDYLVLLCNYHCKVLKANGIALTSNKAKSAINLIEKLNQII